MAGDDLFTPSERRRGLPIGNLTSQFWPNFYTDPFDHFVKDDLGVKGYVRYVDEFLLFGDSKADLLSLREALWQRLDRSFRLLFHERKTRKSRIGRVPGALDYPDVIEIDTIDTENDRVTLR